jgi:hypothetical protein
MGLIADVDAVRGQGELAIEVQVSGAADLDTPDNGLGEAGVLYLIDIIGCVLVEGPTAEDSAISGLGRCGFGERQR